MFLDTRKGMFMKKLILFLAIFCTLYEHSSAEDKSSTVYAYVNGLVCDFCARALEMTIGKQDSVKTIKVDLKDKVITIVEVDTEVQIFYAMSLRKLGGDFINVSGRLSTVEEARVNLDKLFGI